MVWKPLLLTLISFIGILGGGALAFIAPEELKPYKKYFVSVQKAVFGLAAWVFLFWIMLFLFGRYFTVPSSQAAIVYVSAPLLVAVLIITHKVCTQEFPLKYFYPIFAVPFFILPEELLLLQGLLVFVLGLLTGTLDLACYVGKGNKMNISKADAAKLLAMKYAWILAVAVVAAVFFSYVAFF
jgi:hypothetical protein